ncbi:ATP-dependent helicase HrpB [Glaciecola petra]|uniref:ATP-dependent helicase HrpB n=1 Tax=Glaciecola petra TaxID=3075602 RepID=A0ABU2ZP94_9ALTE|nr:ATP-dependent helicase HrpB [Aestuariibacter sp. P117]MDT0594453.1 ATP-dependent helicase HrpB [Aestuariibacter sp. P117]
MTRSLAVAKIEDELLLAIRTKDIILSAPPGSGKSTYLPISLLQKSHFTGQIIMLQPRQIAVRNIAEYIAKQLHEEVGGRVGYQMRGEAKYSNKTQLMIMTEGLLSAKIRNDPELSGVSLIIFDEFHERSLHSDISLALCLDVQRALREELRILVMSATLNIKPLQKLLPTAVNIASEGRSYNVEQYYRPILHARSGLQYYPHDMHKQVLLVVKEVLHMPVISAKGHILVFLPSAKDITMLAQLFAHENLPNISIHKLYGALSAKQQKSVFGPVSKGQQKLILATNIAETSITIDGVSVVIDSGLEKQMSFNLSAQLNELKLIQISKSSATQRAGRAGRQQDGICFRLWSQQQHQYLIENSQPEITRVDISSNELLLQDWGSDFQSLLLIDKPSKAQISHAKNLLQTLCFSHENSTITANGRIAAGLSCHPRSALLLIDAQQHLKNQRTELAFSLVLMVVILENKALDKPAQSRDIMIQMQWFLKELHTNKHDSLLSTSYIKDLKRWCTRFGFIQQYESERQMLKVLSTINLDAYRNTIVISLLRAYGDRLGLSKIIHTNRSSTDLEMKYLLFNGTGVAIKQFNYEQDLGSLPRAIICLGAQVRASAYSLVNLYFQIDDADFEAYCEKNMRTEIEQKWDNKLQKVVFLKTNNIGAIRLFEQNITFEVAKQWLKTAAIFSAEESLLNIEQKSHQILLGQIKEYGLRRISGDAWSLIERINLAHILAPNMQFPYLSENTLFSSSQQWLYPFLKDKLSWQDIKQLNWSQMFEAILTWDQQNYLKIHFPKHFIAPTGIKHKLEYTVIDRQNYLVGLAIRIQELYGLNETPSIANGTLSISLSLLSPANREIQKTKDLGRFWQGSYKEVQKEMKGRYPKHFWPDNPESAIPTLRSKKKM